MPKCIDEDEVKEECPIIELQSCHTCIHIDIIHFRLTFNTSGMQNIIMWLSDHACGHTSFYPTVAQAPKFGIYCIPYIGQINSRPCYYVSHIYYIFI